jgi:periplasmic divalent cation tolerance protein
MGGEHQMVLCTVPDADTAGAIATTLVSEQLAACVNIVSGITSVYRWQGAVESAAECLLLIKTHAHSWPAIESRIQSLHPYELPEIIAVPIETGQQDYLQWITDSLK